MRDGLHHRWAGKHADASADPSADPRADPCADTRTISRPITIKRAHAITVRTTRPDTQPKSEPDP